MSRIAYTGARIFDGEQWWERSALVVDGDRIEGIIAADSPTDAQRVPMGGGILAPGFIDLQVNGGGKAIVTVENSGKTGAVEVIVHGDEEPNRPPIAEVAKELHARSGELVLLDGLRSRDPDGDPLHFEWKQILGHRVILSNVNEAKATFVAPKVSERKRYQFSLVVTDMAGPDVMKGADSVPAIVTVWITP